MMMQSIIIDVNVLPSVFSKNSVEHDEFRHVKEWIEACKGKLVYGGSKYRRELAKLESSYIGILKELDNKRKIDEVPDTEVDLRQKEIDDICHTKSFNDSHILAIVIVSHCELVCTKDFKSIPFLNKREFYPKHIRTPKFYTKAKNRNLLT